MATEVEIIKFEADISQLQKQMREAEKNFKKLEAKGKETSQKTKENFNQMGSSIKGALGNLPFGNLVTQLDTAASSAKDVALGVGKIGSEASGASSGVSKLGTALKVGVLGVLALIIVAFSSIVAFIKSSDEGATKFQATMDGLGAGVDVISGKFSEIGSDLVDSFSNEGGAGKAIWDFTKNLASAGVEVIGFVTGLTLLSESVGELTGASAAFDSLGKKVSDANSEGYKLSTSLDTVQDSLRNLSVESDSANFAIAALLKQTKNKGFDIGERLDIVSKALAIQNENLGKNFALQLKQYSIEAQIILLKTESINQNKKAQVDQVKKIVNEIQYAKTAQEVLVLFQRQQKAQEGLKTVSDEVAQKQVDRVRSLIELDGRAELSAEKFATVRSNLIEKDIADRVEGVKKIERAREAVAINTLKDEQELADKTLEIQIKSLNDQKLILLEFGKDVSQIDLDIAKLRAKHAEDLSKKRQEILANETKEYKDHLLEREKELKARDTASALSMTNRLKEKLLEIDKNEKGVFKNQEEIDKAKLNAEIAYYNNIIMLEEARGNNTVDLQRDQFERIKKLRKGDTDDALKAEQQKKESLKQAGNEAIALGNQVVDEVFARQKQASQDKLTQSQLETDAEIANLNKQKEQGLISEAKYQASINRSKERQAKREREIRKQQAQQEKQQALFSIAINTAVQIAKVASNPFLIALAVAVGAIQAGIVASRPLPKYAKGVIGLQGAGNGTSDSITARLSKGESVMTAKETDEHRDALMAMRGNTYDKHINESWVLPAIKKLERQRKYKESIRDKSMQRISRMGKDLNLEHLERLTSRNSNITVKNVDELASAMVRRINRTGII